MTDNIGRLRLGRMTQHNFVRRECAKGNPLKQGRHRQITDDSDASTSHAAYPSQAAELYEYEQQHQLYEYHHYRRTHHQLHHHLRTFIWDYVVGLQIGHYWLILMSTLQSRHWCTHDYVYTSLLALPCWMHPFYLQELAIHQCVVSRVLLWPHYS